MQSAPDSSGGECPVVILDKLVFHGADIKQNDVGVLWLMRISQDIGKVDVNKMLQAA